MLHIVRAKQMTIVCARYLLAGFSPSVSVSQGQGLFASPGAPFGKGATEDKENNSEAAVQLQRDGCEK